MAKADLNQRPEQALRRRGMFAPATANSDARTVDLVWSTGAPVNRSDWMGNSFIEELSMAPGAVRLDRLNAGAPLLNSHENSSLAAVIGVVERAWIEGGEGRATVRFSDRPDIEPIWRDVRSGILPNVSVGYRTHQTERDESGTTPVERAVDWEPLELSLVAIPADPGAQTRSHPNPSNKKDNMANTAIDNDQQTENLPLDRRERQRCAQILDACRKAGLDPEVSQQLITDGVPIDQARALIIDAFHHATHDGQPQCQRRFSDPANDYTSSSQTTLQRGIEAAIVRGEDQILAELLRAEGVRGRGAFELVERAMHATTDLPLSLTSSLDLRLQQLYPTWQGGIMFAADVRPISDYRPYGVVDTGLVGTAKKVKEGGETPYTTIKESGITTRANRFVHALAWSSEAQANNSFLGGLRQGGDELGMGAIDAEKSELIYLLEGTANGGTCADGQALFHNSHNNAVASGPIGIDKLGQAVALLRAQKSVGGRFIDQQPAMILCGTGAEMTLRQLLSSAMIPNQPSSVNPWAGNLQIEVEPRLGDSYCYLLSAGPRRPLELGRLYPAPRITSTVDFETGAFKTKAEHSFGVAVTEYRAIVRIKLSA
jgi:phage head maturation protease